MFKNYKNIKSHFQNNKCWGISTSVDAKNCDPELIRDKNQLKKFVDELCELIEMKKFGETQIIHFGKDKRVMGYSLIQFIETSLISGHFAEIDNSAYIDVFSCSLFDPYLLGQFIKNYFKSPEINIHIQLRR